MLRLQLTSSDLERVSVVTQFASMLELAGFVRRDPAPHAGTFLRQWRAGARDRLNPAHTAMVSDLVRWACTPGFMTPVVRDREEAVDAVARTPAVVARNDLADSVAAGMPLAPWAEQLGQAGPSALRVRHRLAAALNDLHEHAIDPVLHHLAPLAQAQAQQLRQILRSLGPAAALDSMHPRIRLSNDVLEVELASGAEVETTSLGAGLMLIPTLVPYPGITVSSTGLSPAVLTYPVHLPPSAEWDALLANRPPMRAALPVLIGITRAKVLAAIAAGPGLSTRGLARATGFSAASVSEHAAVLRANWLVFTVRDGSGAAHFVTELGEEPLQR